MKQRLYKFIFYRILGWKLIGTVDASVKKCVFSVIPHTSNFDFFLGLFSRGIIDLEMNFVGKKELFVFPIGYYFKRVGGAPLDRSGGKNNVDATVAVFNSREVFRLALSPEGTRRKVSQLRSGFYYIAHKASVPIIPVAFDYGKKEVRLGSPFYTTGDYESDMNLFLPFFRDVVGKNKENGYQIE